ncbi:hypothetical protein E4U44_007384 [Claviceps purpurea]|nr:hypothetical protein E4U44_007384 [Claviceps purpurea]
MGMTFKADDLEACASSHVVSVSARRSRHSKSPEDPPYAVPFVPTWDVAIEPGQDEKIILYGTIEQADAYMELHYPGWTVKYANWTATHPNPVKLGPASLPELMEVKKVKCNWPSYHSPTRPLLRGIERLRSISKARYLRSGPSPRMCAIVSCSQAGAIILCNDTDKAMKTLEHFSDLAFAAQNVVQKCVRGFRNPRVSGKIFFVRGFSIIARRWDCNVEWPGTGHGAAEIPPDLPPPSRPGPPAV